MLAPNRSLAALLAEIIDYAGLFPPAALDLDAAVRTFARHRAEGASWMLGRFICPVGKLVQLAEYRQTTLAGQSPARISTLPRGGDGVAAFTASLGEDLAQIARFNETCAGAALVDALEIKLPPSVLKTGDEGAVCGLLAVVAEQLSAASLRVPAYFECPLGETWRRDVQLTASALATQNVEFAKRGLAALGFKLRTGGLEASAFPTSEQVAVTLIECRDAGVPLKFTAGLHHPLRHFDAGVRTMMHGFVNLFVAGVLGATLALDEADIRGIIDEQDARQFCFDEDSLSWCDAEALVDETTFARTRRVVSFGSCSFDEPVEDLARLGWLRVES